jgi:hypothetical protein
MDAERYGHFKHLWPTFMRNPGDFRPLVKYWHSLGIKIGLYISAQKTTHWGRAGTPGPYQHKDIEYFTSNLSIDCEF